MTPLEAIRKVCVSCVGSPYEVKDCAGNKCLNGQGGQGTCYFYRYRMGRGRPSVKLIRKFCRECQGGSSKLVARCESDCPVRPFRFGKNPKLAGRLPKHLEKYQFTAQKNSQDRISHGGAYRFIVLNKKELPTTGAP